MLALYLGKYSGVLFSLCPSQAIHFCSTPPISQIHAVDHLLTPLVGLAAVTCISPLLEPSFCPHNSCLSISNAQNHLCNTQLCTALEQKPLLCKELRSLFLHNVFRIAVLGILTLLFQRCHVSFLHSQ
jgi:hypothetical protein